MEEKNNGRVADKISENMSVKKEADRKISSRSVMVYIDVICILTGVIALELILGIIVFKEMTSLLLVIMALSLIMALFTKHLHNYFLIVVGAVELVVGGLTQHTIIALMGTVLFAAMCFAIRKFLK